MVHRGAGPGPGPDPPDPAQGPGRPEGGPGQQFGVFLRGAKAPVTEDHLDRGLRPPMPSSRRIAPSPSPACLFHFTMDDDQGYSTWVAEPAVTDEGPRLLMHEAPHGRKLDNAALDEIVGKVDRW